MLNWSLKKQKSDQPSRNPWGRSVGKASSTSLERFLGSLTDAPNFLSFRARKSFQPPSQPLSLLFCVNLTTSTSTWRRPNGWAKRGGLPGPGGLLCWHAGPYLFLGAGEPLGHRTTAWRREAAGAEAVVSASSCGQRRRRRGGGGRVAAEWLKGMAGENPFFHLGK
jgi:hypothetical protein